jgi:hypothetical protein
MELMFAMNAESLFFFKDFTGDFFGDLVRDLVFSIFSVDGASSSSLRLRRAGVVAWRFGELRGMLAKVGSLDLEEQTILRRGDASKTAA